MRNRRCTLTVLTTGVLLSACGPQDPSSLRDGNDLYDYYCAACHRKNDLGARLENLPLSERKLRPHEIMLMLRHGYEFEHPAVYLPQLTPEQADAIAQYAYSLPNHDN